MGSRTSGTGFGAARLRGRHALCLTVALALAAVAIAEPQAEFQPQFKPTLEIRRAAGPIRIDGDLDDPGWQGAAQATGFAENSPGDQVAPPVASETWVTYDEENLTSRSSPAMIPPRCASRCASATRSGTTTTSA